MKTARQIQSLIYFLVAVGVIFIYNSSIVHSQNVFGSPHRFFILHMVWVALGLLAFKFFSNLDTKKYLGLSPLIYTVTLLLLGFLALWGILPCEVSPSFAPCVNSANRWFVFNLPYVGELSFQPSELAKLAIILFLAFKLKLLSTKKSSKPFTAYLLYTGIASFLVLLQPNMSTAVLVFIIGTSMYFASGGNVKPLLVLAPILLLLSALFILVSPYRRERLETYLNRTQISSQIEEGYQVRQVKIALGSGGLFGVGFGQSRQKYTYLPEVATDSIFAVIGEEFGFLGSVVILVTFVLLVLKGFEVAKTTDDLSKKLVAVGIVTWIASQFLIHMAANSGLIPYTGVPLPLISYGGSSLLFSMIALGMLVNIAKNK